MKKIIIPLLCWGMLCGCADKTENSASAADKETAVTESTTAIVTTSTFKTTTTITLTAATTVETQPITQVDLGTPPPLALATADGLTETHSRSIFDTLSEPPYYFYTHEDSTYYYIPTFDKSHLSYKGRQISYTDSSGEDCTDTYFYNSVKETETLINRSVNGKTVLVNPCQVYIERKPEALYVTLKDTGELVQTINGDFSSEVDKYEGVDGFEEHYYQGVDVLEFADYDFDGYDDIFFQTSINTANEPGIYYHFNPETCLFEEWDELNQIGLQCYFGDDKTLKVSVTGSAVDHETTVYKWNNECLVPVSREVQYADGKNDIYIDYYEYNENSEEILVKREKALLDEDKNWLGTEEVEISEVIK